MRPAHTRSALAALLFLSATAYADTAPTPDIPDELRDRAARAAKEKEYAEAMRSAMATSIGTGVQLSQGAISREADSVLPSAARIAAYESLRGVAVAICTELKGKTLVVAPVVSLSDLRHQYNATREQLKYLTRRTDTARTSLDKPGTRVEAAFGPAAVLALDTAGAIGKAVVGLAGLFKSERKISMVADVLDAPTVMLALRSCPSDSRPTFVDAVPAWDTEISNEQVNLLQAAANNLRASIEKKQGELETKKAEVADAKAASEADKDNPAKKATLTKRTDEASSLTIRLTPATAMLTVADAVLDKLYTVVDATGVSPLVALVRINDILKIADNGNAKVLTVKVLHASGYSQISKAWWRNDRLDFGSGIAITYEITTAGGAFDSANAFYQQSPWMRLKEGESSMATGLNKWYPLKAKAEGSAE